MRERPESVLQRLAAAVERNNRIVISAITYAEMRYGQIGKKVAPKHKTLVDEFVRRLDAVLPWDQIAVDATVEAKLQLTLAVHTLARTTPLLRAMQLPQAVRWSRTTCANSAALKDWFSKTGSLKKFMYSAQ
jgi:hypothetical protein